MSGPDIPVASRLAGNKVVVPFAALYICCYRAQLRLIAQSPAITILNYFYWYIVSAQVLSSTISIHIVTTCNSSVILSQIIRNGIWVLGGWIGMTWLDINSFNFAVLEKSCIVWCNHEQFCPGIEYLEIDLDRSYIPQYDVPNFFVIVEHKFLTRIDMMDEIRSNCGT